MGDDRLLTLDAPESLEPPTDVMSSCPPGPAGLAVLLVLMATFVAYVAVLQFGFVFDDGDQIVHNVRLTSWSYLPLYFTQHMWAQMPDHPALYYRPLGLLWFRLNMALIGLTPGWWHLAALALHVGVTGMLYALVKRLTRDPITALIAALIFGLHPVHIESVAWISGAGDPLLAIFLVGSLLAYIAGWQRDRRAQMWALALFLYACGLLTKEPAIVWPAVIFGYTCLFHGKYLDAAGSKLRIATRALGYTLPWILLTAVYLVIRYSVIGRFSGESQPHSLSTLAFTTPRAAMFYLFHLVCPVGLSIAYPFEFVHRPTAAFLGPMLAILAIAAVIVSGLWWLRRTSNSNDQSATNLLEFRTGMFSVLLFVATIAIPLNLRLPAQGFEVQDRYLYVPSLGFAILAAIALRRLKSTARLSGIPVVQLAAVALIGVAMAVGLVTQLPVWKNEIALFSNAVNTAPGNFKMNGDLGIALSNADRPKEAIPYLEDALLGLPNEFLLNLNLGWCYGDLGDLQKAEHYLARAAQIHPYPQLLEQLRSTQEELARRGMQPKP